MFEGVSFARSSVHPLEEGILPARKCTVGSPLLPPAKTATPVRRHPCVLLVGVSSKRNPTRVGSAHPLEGCLLSVFLENKVDFCLRGIAFLLPGT